jgi:hypothetical protein
MLNIFYLYFSAAFLLLFIEGSRIERVDEAVA